MISDWPKRTFSALVGGPKNTIGGPFGSNLTQADYVDAGVPIIRGSNMEKAGRYIAGEFVFVGPEKARILKSNHVYPGDIIVTQRGTLGQISIVPSDRFDDYIVSQSQMGVRPGNSDSRFIYYLLRSEHFQDFLESATIQTGVPHINMGILRNWEVRAPDLPEQIRIADILDAIDSKIEHNHRVVSTLEEMALALFDSWFVDFDPVHAKAEGRDPALPAEIAALFPDRFGDDGLPVGWVMDKVGTLFDIVAGNTPSTFNEDFWGAGHAWATPKDMSSLRSPILDQTSRQLTDAGLAAASSGLVPAGSLLLSSRAPIGYLAFAAMPLAINQGIAAFVRKQISTFYAWAWCQMYMDIIKSGANGSTFQEISKGTLRQLPMLRPSSAVTVSYDSIVSSYYKRVVQISEEIETLTYVRDLLLPMLISGELRVPEEAQRVEAA